MSFNISPTPTNTIIPAGIVPVTRPDIADPRITSRLEETNNEKGEPKGLIAHNIWLGFVVASLIIITFIAWDDTLRRGISDYYGEENQNDASFVHAIVLTIFTLILLYTVIFFFS